MKKVILIIIVIIFSFAITTITLNAHSEIVNVKYDNCEFDEINNKWYTLDLIDEEDYIDHLLHVPENLLEIKYYIHDNGLDNDNYTWTTNVDEKIANEIKQTYVESMKKWNDVYYYSYEENGNKIENKIINIAEASNQSESNLDIFPCYMQGGDYIACVMQNSYPETIHDTVNISHYHCNKWNMNVNIYYFVESFYNNINGVEINKQTTGAHEIGHILGLGDIDKECELKTNEGDHHQSIMGYASNKRCYITYQDIAGVSITRGFHTDEDHVWMKRTNSDQTIDLICAQCNGVLYDVELDENGQTYKGKELNIYKDCVHYNGTNNNMLLVATNGKMNFYKCQNCRYIEETDNKGSISNDGKLVFNDTKKEGKNYLLYDLTVENSGLYSFYSYNQVNTKVELYDENFNKLFILDKNKDSKINYFNKELTEGKYFLKVIYESDVSKNNQLFIFGENNKEYLKYGENNLKQSVSNGINEYYFNTIDETGFYKISINGKNLDGSSISLPRGSIEVYDSSIRLSLFNKNFNYTIDDASETKEEENTLYIYLNENKMYYLNLGIPLIEYDEISISIEKIEENTLVKINDINEIFSGQEITLLYDINNKYDYFKKISINESGIFNINSHYEGTQSENIKVLILKSWNNGGGYVVQKVYETILNNEISYTSNNVTLLDGEYYIGYINLQSGYIESVTISRVISNTEDQVSNAIIVDPSSVDTCGSQINIIEKNLTNKSYRQNYITKGFTRCIFLDTQYCSSDSRLSYYWYSSNEEIAEVTEYGTVLGKKLGNVVIYGVYRNDPSKVYVKEFEIVNESNTEEVILEIFQTYSLNSDKDCKINLNANNSPYPMVQYYTFSIVETTNDMVANLDNFGKVIVDKPGIITIRGRYILNIDYVVFVYLTITE